MAEGGRTATERNTPPNETVSARPDQPGLRDLRGSGSLPHPLGMTSPVYRGPALLLTDGLEIQVQAELTGNVPEVGLPGWTGMLESSDTRFSAGSVRFGRLRLPDGWEGG